MKLDKRFFYLYLFSFFFIITQLFSDQLNPLFKYNQVLILRGEYYRLISFYFCHITWSHWLVNHLQFGLLFYWMLPFLNNRLWTYFFGLIILGISGSQLFLSTDSDILGFSGINYALASLFLLLGQGKRKKWFLGIWVILLIKLTSEALLGSSLSENFLGLEVAHRQHLIGLLMGLIFFIVFFGIDKSQKD